MMETDNQIASPIRAAFEAAENVHHTVQGTFPEAVADFESKWTAFQAVCHSLPASASPRDCTRTDEFETLRKQGPKILAFVVFKLATDVDQNSHGAFLFNALVNDPKYRGVPDDDLTSKEALQRYSGQIVELSFQLNKVYGERVKVWKEYCETYRAALCRNICCCGDEYWDLLEVGPAFIPQLMVEYAGDRGGYWYELLHEIVHGHTMEAYALFDRPEWFDYWRAFLNGVEYQHAPKYIPNEWDIYILTGKMGPKINLGPRAKTPPRGERDIPLPSQESPSLPFLFQAGSSSTSENEFSFRTPLISVSPTPDPEQREYAFSPVPSPRAVASSGDHTSDQLCDATAQLGVNSNGGLSDFRDLSSALNENRLAQTPRTTQPSLTPLPDQRDRSRGSTHRRSSSGLKRYNVSDEEPPKDAFNSSEFQSALRLAKAVAGELADVLSSSPLHREEDSKMHELHRKAAVLAGFKPTATRVVGFVGGAGAGKSSVLNSLLDEVDLVKSGSAGGACTCAATEFHYHESDTLSIQLQLFDEDELLKQQMQLLRSYRHFHLADLSEAEQDNFGELARLAEDTFSSLFQSQLPSQSTLLNEDEDCLRSIFRRLITNLRPSISHTVMTGLTKQACSEKLRELTSAPASSTGESATRAAAWPYIENIKVFLNAQILKKGLILVDLPGLRDINSARRNITELYIRKCNEIFAVCPAARATDDETVQEIFRMAEHLENISIICTNSEAINAKECKKDWPGERADTIDEKLTTIEEHLYTIEELEEELESFPEEEHPLHENTRRLNELNANILKAKKSEEVCQFELQSFLINCRNDDLVKGLRRKYRTDPSLADTNVFCVSNTLYQKKRQAKIEIAQAYINLSGIIDLRRHCVSIVSANQHREASGFIKTDIPKLLAAIDLWVQSGEDTWDGELRAAVKTALDDVEAWLESALDRQAPFRKISQVLCQVFEAEVYDKRRVNEWSESAYSAAHHWSAWHHATYSAFCRQYGNYTTNAVGHHDWNGEANGQMARHMKSPWQALVSRAQAEEVRIPEFHTSSTNYVAGKLENHTISSLAAMAPLRQALYLEQDLLLDAVQNAFESASLQLRQLRTDAFSSLRTSYIGLAMESSYDACNHESGAGSHGRRKARISEAFGNEDLFDGIMKKLRTEFKELAKTAQNDVTAAVQSYLSEIGNTLNLLRDENTANESQRDAAFHRRVSNALKASQETLQDVARRIQA